MRSKLWLGFLLLLSMEPAWALRCSPFLVLEGDYEFQVLRKCGEPDYYESRVEYRWIPAPVYGLTPPGPAYGALVPVYVDVWIYNFGPQRFMQRLIFENGRLIQIKDLGYGY